MTESDFAPWTPGWIEEMLTQHATAGVNGMALLRAADGRVISRGYAGMGESMEVELSEVRRAIVEGMLAKGQLVAEEWTTCPEPSRVMKGGSVRLGYTGATIRVQRLVCSGE